MERFDASEYEPGVREFFRALAERPDWAEARFNRDLAHLRSRRRGEGLADLKGYLDFRPEAVVEQREVQPYLEPGLEGAAAITLIGAVLVLVSTRTAGRRAATPDGSALEWTLPAMGAT